MSAWDPKLYLRFGDERTRAARDLLAQVPVDMPRLVYDLGCGPGNSTELLVGRFPGAEIVGIDSSPQMLARARQSLPAIEFRTADLQQWRPERPADLLFANAVFQWLPNHIEIFQQLLGALPVGGVLAVQMPDNLAEPAKTLIRDVAADGPWAARLAAVRDARGLLPPAEVYYDALRPLCRQLDLWHTTYHHVLTGTEAIVEWMEGSGLRPYLAALDSVERDAFLADYKARVTAAYPPRADGRVLLHFPRFFVIAVRA
ncbi:MAG: trans-aconitate 2-methyltransferase [Methylovirgula sp.]|nr:trans-aconitate 2-methyltransferase [Methylovirgula sp.]